MLWPKLKLNHNGIELITQESTTAPTLVRPASRMTNTNTGLRVKSLNCRKQEEVVKSLLNDASTMSYDVLCLQELPYHFDQRTSCLSSLYHRFLPTNHALRKKEDLIRSAIYVKKTIPLDSYAQIELKTLDITAVTLTVAERSLSIYSIYNPPASDSSLSFLHKHFDSVPQTHSLLFTGDFTTLSGPATTVQCELA